LKSPQSRNIERYHLGHHLRLFTSKSSWISNGAEIVILLCDHLISQLQLGALSFVGSANKGDAGVEKLS
jgi:hypothetical protein